ncbi:MAG: hypothetical protein H0W68_14730 [Gemmatimonadaceae bacterium]|nr:hypothetical protein [Gemmatimonadaceae bacterium]
MFDDQPDAPSDRDLPAKRERVELVPRWLRDNQPRKQRGAAARAALILFAGRRRPGTRVSNLGTHEPANLLAKAATPGRRSRPRCSPRVEIDLDVRRLLRASTLIAFRPIGSGLSCVPFGLVASELLA